MGPPGSLALLEDSHADLAARIVAAAATLKRYSLDPIAIEDPDQISEIEHPDTLGAVRPLAQALRQAASRLEHFRASGHRFS